MQTAIVIPCSARDEAALPIIEHRLNELKMTTQIWVAPCSKNPPNSDLGTTSKLRWGTAHITTDMLTAMAETGAETVYKLDSDIWFNRLPKWVGDLEGITGYQHPGFSSYIGGAFYGVGRSSIKAMLDYAKNHTLRETMLEDVGVSRLALAAGIDVTHQTGLSGYNPEADLKTPDLLHLGQNWPRSQMTELMRSLTKK